MKGHVPTPDELCEKIVRRAFQGNPPTNRDRILYPGCGDAPFAATVERVCDAEGWEYPDGLGIEINPERLSQAQNQELQHVEFRQQDFLDDSIRDVGKFEYIVGNPPYVPIEGLSEDEKNRYRKNFRTAVERFDLYLLFFERSLDLLADNGILTFITPEKFEYVNTAAPLRRLLTNREYHVEEIEHVEEDAFTGKITFPCITTVRRNSDSAETVVKLRDRSTHTTTLSGDESWASSIRGAELDEMHTGATLGDITERISPGIATGADKIFVMKQKDVPDEIEERWVWPTVSGKQLREFDEPYTDSVFVCPYDVSGDLADPDELGEFLNWLKDHRDRLEDRSCVENGKKWYAWHENPPMSDILQKKIIFRDIDKNPTFWADTHGNVVPKHSVYYAIPKEGVPFDELLNYLNSPKARLWMEANCQKAHNGFYRLQSRVLEDLPVPTEWAESYQMTL